MKKNQVAIIHGSQSDNDLVVECENVLRSHGVYPFVNCLSAHRDHALLGESIQYLDKQGFKIVIAIAGMAAALPGVIASQTKLPVIGVPADSGFMGGLDALLSICQMPSGVPVATMGVGKAGAKNAAHLALRILTLLD